MSGSVAVCSRCSRPAPSPAAPAVARLETGGVLTEAIALYRATGWVEVAPFNDEPFADHWFEKQLP